MYKDGLQLKYFVLNPNKNDAYGRASRIAINAYANAIKENNPHFAQDLYNWMGRIITNIEKKEK